MQVSFDIDEFLAYLLTGCFMLIALGGFYPDILQGFIRICLPLGQGSRVTFVTILATAALILILGHFSSIVSRSITRRILHGIFFNPRMMIFRKQKDDFWNKSLKEAILSNFREIFGYDFLKDKATISAPRLIRSYVLNHYPATREIRDRIVRARSLCANSVLPATILSLAFFKTGNCVAGTALFFLALSMLWKQHDLDVREWKEIYTAFAKLRLNDFQR